MEVAANGRNAVVCPKPRWINPNRPWQTRNQAKPSALSDIFLSEDGEANQMSSSSPPFFAGSPPVRSTNPLIHDACFGDDKLVLPFLLHPAPPSVALEAPAKFRLQPAAMRVEGFECLDRDRRRGHGIAAIA
ncbi:uncharacterized protein LOC135636278 [Musa acuminata AAA Group]|uniref:(wild Malaysian banana) hypothetical protein n=1 Tax=Musa acuminata subsp. malaccensis TaxID=214687 RepID=A0A804IJJ7_MUSAM|nr:PREDICTED: uncharacterized protein LOC103980409 [Musa acuminata subsp. malaccensis]CAG1840814.1 unnamed protein product [Musa acuminata subsp. malaccensis]